MRVGNVERRKQKLHDRAGLLNDNSVRGSVAPNNLPSSGDSLCLLVESIYFSNEVELKDKKYLLSTLLAKLVAIGSSLNVEEAWSEFSNNYLEEEMKKSAHAWLGTFNKLKTKKV